MNLCINYLPNQTGLEIQQSLDKVIANMKNRTIYIQGVEYNEIILIDDKSNVNLIINTIKSIENIMDIKTASDIFALNGISADLRETEAVARTYEVLLCNLNVVSIRLTTHASSKNQVKYIRETENFKVCDMAKRALYLMGLDIGMVTIVLTTKRRFKVRAINPSPIVRDKDLPYMIKMIAELYRDEGLIPEQEIKLGADPEFMLINSKNGKMISASEFFPRDGLVGCDNIRIPNRQQRPIAEIRPKPDESPLELINNIRYALASAGKLAPYKNVKWLAGSQPINGYSIGGHIHFSRVKINGLLLRTLDNYLAIPIFLIEDPVTATKRRKKYGYLADYRLKEHGGFEYRTPSSWLVSQRIATAILCLAKIVASRYLYLPQDYLNDLEAQQAFYNGDQPYFKQCFINLWKNLKEIDLYDTYAEELKIIPELIMAGKNWDEKADFRKSWKIASANKSYAKNTVGVNNIPTTNTSMPTQPITRRNFATASRNTHITTVRTTPAAVTTDRRANSTTSGRIIGSGQVRRSQQIR